MEKVSEMHKSKTEIAPGRQLDALIAEKVMGWTWHFYPKDQSCYKSALESGQKGYWLDGVVSCVTTNEDGTPNCPAYSTDIKSAWKVVDKLKTIKDEHRDVEFKLEYCQGMGEWLCTFIFAETPFQSKSAPHAICLAALEAIGENNEPNTN